jgi:multisubunit Na+/H+ antiporter MnhB subunit
MSKALQQLWVRRTEVGFIAVVLITSALLLTFVITAHDTQSFAKVALALPAVVFALLAPAGLILDRLRPQKLVYPPETFLASIHGRSPPA